MNTLYLLPNLLDPSGSYVDYIPSSICKIVCSLKGLFAENEKEARRYLLQFMDRQQMQMISIKLLNEHTDQNELYDYIKLVETQGSWGVISDAGMPVLADPGSQLIYLAHQRNIQLKTVPGPSSIMMALILSGLSGQKFTFHGYLPRKEEELTKELQVLERQGKTSTQIWIETPYRTDKMINLCIKSLDSSTIFSVASSLCTPDEKVITTTIKKWKESKPVFGKKPAVFLLKGKKK